MHRWQPQEMGWRCKNGRLLNTCCIVCGVWITDRGREFDDYPHSCNPVDKAKYRARRASGNALRNSNGE